MKKSYLKDVAKDIRDRAAGNRLSKTQAETMMERIRASNKLIDIMDKQTTSKETT